VDWWQVVAMKSLQSLVSTCVVLLTATVAFAASLDVQDLLTEGQLAYQKGDIEKAKAAFEMVYKMDSRNQVAIGYLRRIKVDEASKPKGNDQEKQLAALIIPKIEFRDATLGSALDYFKKTVDKQSGGKQAVNFVVQLPAEQVNTPVTLNLSNIPVTEALRYLGELVNATFVYEKYAVMVKPKSGAVAPVPAPTAAQ
jgi:hypothetical protein